MKFLELKPTKENLYHTFINDTIGRSKDICMLIDMFMNIDEVSSIGMDGKWGSGKTFFVKQCKMLIDSLNPNTEFSKEKIGEAIKSYYVKNNGDSIQFAENPMVAVYFDAWKYDDDTDPVLSLIYEIIKCDCYSVKLSHDRNWKDIVKSIADIASGLNISSLFDALDGTDLLKAQKDNNHLDVLIEQFFSMLLPEKGNRLIIFIDELDRCSPTYAIKLLERIKHYFTCDNVTFVFSVNFRELENSIKHFYGNGIDACKYLDRFFDIRMQLPSVDMEKYLSSIGVQKYGGIRESVSLEMIKLLNMEMREISRYLLLSKMAANKYTDSKSNTNNFANYPYEECYLIGYCVIVPIAIALKLNKSEDFYDFMEGRDSKWLRNIMTGSLKDWIGRLILDKNESFTEKKDYIKVDINQRIEDIYRAIFIESKESTGKQPEVGKIIVKEGFFYSLSKAVGMVSDLTNYSV